VARPRRATARAAALPARRPVPSIGRYLPSPRSLAVGFALVALAVGGYVAARETSVFAVRELEVSGGSPELQAEVRAALRPELGRSLVAVQGSEIARRLARVPGVLAVRSDRHFPHTLRVVVTPERPVLLLRRGNEGWVVSARSRVLRAVEDPRAITLPRFWVTKDTNVKVGEMLSPESGGAAARALAPLGASALPATVRAVRARGGLTLVLASAPEVRLGDLGDLRLKLAVARRLLLLEAADPAVTYVDVSVPDRPVVGTSNPQVAGEA
jgi:cell division protein FtsQ